MENIPLGSDAMFFYVHAVCNLHYATVASLKTRRSRAATSVWIECDLFVLYYSMMLSKLKTKKPLVTTS
jgi:hypothetical protein